LMLRSPVGWAAAAIAEREPLADCCIAELF
jgi:hypothetical protein